MASTTKHGRLALSKPKAITNPLALRADIGVASKEAKVNPNSPYALDRRVRLTYATAEAVAGLDPKWRAEWERLTAGLQKPAT